MEVRTVVQGVHLMDAHPLEAVGVRLDHIEQRGGSPFARGTTMSAIDEMWSRTVSGSVDDTMVRTRRA